MEQDEEEKEHEQGREAEQDKDHDGNVTPSRKKEIMVIKTSRWSFNEFPMTEGLNAHF